MPTSLSFEDHLNVLRVAGHRLTSLAASIDESTRVPTCPAWDVRTLLAHQTTVHRWATANITGTNPDDVPNQTEVKRSVKDIVTHYQQGLDDLVAALNAAPAGLEAMTFLNDAPSPRAFWARRQAHETSMHMVDALAATVGRFPSAQESNFDTAFAEDGVDELLCGFFTRGRSKLYDGKHYSTLVVPSDSDRRWLMQVAERLTVDPRPGGNLDAADVTLSASAAQLYLGLWNRGDEITVAGRSDLLDSWRQTQRIT